MNRLRISFALAVVFALFSTPGWSEEAPRSPAKAAPKKTTAAEASAHHALAQHLCEAIHTIPAERKGQCCGTKPSSLTSLCTKELSASLDRGGVTLDAASIESCKEAVSHQVEGCGWVSPVLPPLPDACRDVVEGHRTAGAGCRSSIECLDGLACLGAGPEREGICAGPTKARARCEVPADDAVAFTRADASRHPTCDGLCIKGFCVPFSPAEGACQSSAICGARLHCIAGHCEDKPLPAIGEACPGGTSCGFGAHCLAGTCIALKNAGEPCTLPSECRALECAKVAGQSEGKCGTPCGPSHERGMDPKAENDSGTSAGTEVVSSAGNEQQCGRDDDSK